MLTAEQKQDIHKECKRRAASDEQLAAKIGQLRSLTCPSV